jgi:hypothetical protein
MLLVLTGGCAGTSGLAPLRQGLLQDAEALQLERIFEIGVGPVAMFLVRPFIPVKADSRGVLSAVSRVEIGVYETDQPLKPRDIDIPLRKLAKAEGWLPLLRIQEDDELTWVLYPANDRKLRELFMVVLEGDELVLMKVKGDVTKVIRSLQVIT